MDGSKTDLWSSLRDCGFSEESAAQYLVWARQGNTRGLLYRQRKAAMEELHGAQRRVDILDYMIRSLGEPERREYHGNDYIAKRSSHAPGGVRGLPGAGGDL